jgi:hypothetical protein
MNRKNLILGGVLIILIALAWAYQGPFKTWQAQVGKPKNFLAGIEMDKITKIELVKLGSTTTLESISGRWKISGTKNFYAKASDVTALINALKEAEKVDLEIVSENKDKKSDFLTDEQRGVKLQISEGDKVKADLVIGKTGNDYASSYISKVNDNKTYFLKTNLTSVVSSNDWRDNTILAGDKTKITKIRFQYPDRQFTIEKKGDKWSVNAPKPTALKTEKIDEILTLMTTLTASKIPAQTFKGTGLEKSKIIIQATGDGIDNTIMVGTESAQDKGMYFSKSGSNDNIYLISKDDRAKLDKKTADLK